MKQKLTLLACILFAVSVWAQSPEKMSYQAVVRNSSDVLVSNTQIGVQISILQSSASGAAVYVETQMPTTNANGLISIEIGEGTVEFGDFTSIDWGNGPYFIKTETDLDGGSNYTISGTSQLLSVPYALHAKTAETITGSISESDPLFTSSEANNITADDITNLSNLSGSNSGDQDITGIADNTQAIQDTASQIRADIPDVSGFLSSETDPSVPAGTQAGEMQYWDGAAWITVPTGNEGQVLTFMGNVPTWKTQVGIGDVINPVTGHIWMEKNLGATQVAISTSDVDAYGDLYQWGRVADGHESRTSVTTSVLSNDDTPLHGDFIISGSGSEDWRSTQNDNLWQGTNGLNNPCPTAYRLPTQAEWEAEMLSWSSNNSAGALASPLKLPAAGRRVSIDGSFNGTDYVGYYWSSTVSGVAAMSLRFGTGNVSVQDYERAYGFSVRCIKD